MSAPIVTIAEPTALEPSDISCRNTAALALTVVRDALARVDDGTFGRCIVDGGPIEEKRLDAVPWTPYCLKHEQLLEASSASKTPSL